MCIKIARRSRQQLHSENNKKRPFFHDATDKTRATCKISTFYGDLTSLNHRNHFKRPHIVILIMQI